LDRENEEIKKDDEKYDFFKSAEAHRILQIGEGDFTGLIRLSICLINKLKLKD
jgi:hypothetical protein